jgi:hypothetical protein
VRTFCVLAAVTLVLVVSPANVSAQPVAPSALQGRVSVVCARVPNLLARADQLMQRLPAGPETPRSIAWVKAKAQAARARNRTQLAEQLDDRATVLTQKLALLPNQKAALQNVQQQCAAYGYPS